MCRDSGRVCCRWSKWGFPPGLHVGVKEREESGEEPGAAKNKKAIFIVYLD